MTTTIYVVILQFKEILLHSNHIPTCEVSGTATTLIHTGFKRNPQLHLLRPLLQQISSYSPTSSSPYTISCLEGARHGTAGSTNSVEQTLELDLSYPGVLAQVSPKAMGPYI